LDRAGFRPVDRHEIVKHKSVEELNAHLVQTNKKPIVAGYGFGFLANLKWFIVEQRKILLFNEGVFIFMLSLSLVLNKLTPMLWVFFVSQLFWGLYRSWEHGRKIDLNQHSTIEK
jgi:hypothetical protein